MLGVLLLPVMAVAGITLWLKRRKARKELEKTAENNEEQNL
jgi:uncharacterized iron-regulated membrane protein